MAKKAAERMVMAYGADGQLVPTPEGEVVRVPVCPIAIDSDKGTPITPRFLRFCMCAGDDLPDRILKIEQLPDQAGCRVKVSFARPFVGFVLDGKKHMRDSRGMFVFNEADATDPYFAAVPPGDRAALLAAIQRTN